MKAAFIFVLTSIFTFLLSACTTTQSGPQTVEQLLAKKGYTIGPPTDRVEQFRFTGWNYLDREHVMLTLPGSRHYLISLRVSCNSLYGAHVIDFSNIGSGSFLTNSDTLIVRDNGNVQESGIPEHCMIESMNELVSRENKTAT